jgi:hypothetical protein
VPNSWTVEHPEPTYLALAIREDHACSADLRPYAWSLLLGLDSFKGQLKYQLSQHKSMKWKILDEKPVVLSGLSGRDIRLSVKQEMNSLLEHRITPRRGMTLFVLGTYQLATDGVIPAIFHALPICNLYATISGSRTSAKLKIANRRSEWNKIACHVAGEITIRHRQVKSRATYIG